MPSFPACYRWFPPYQPIWHPFFPGAGDIREWNFELHPPGTSLPVPISGTRLQVRLDRILIETGIALTPATSAFDPRAWFGLLRYAGDFTGTAPSLRWYSGVSNKDPRLKAVASEEVATGITCYLLREHFNLDHIADAYAVIQSGDLEYVNSNSDKRPDYFCLDSSGEAVIVESKGATGTRSIINSRINPEGWDQVQNVQPVNHGLRSNCSRVVIGTHFCIEGQHQRSETTTIIKDPEGEKGRGINELSDTPVRLAYAKAFRFMGNDTFADMIVLKRNLPNLDLPTDEINGISIWILGYNPFGNLMGIEKKTGLMLFQAPSENSLAESSLNDHLRKFREIRVKLKGKGFALPNGIVALDRV
jgi:hypothetical protein